MPRARQILGKIAREDMSSERAKDRRSADLSAAELSGAAQRGELALHFQPVVAVRGGTCERVEALLRWSHPKLGPIDPRDIVRLAESAGQLTPLALWALRGAAAERGRWHQTGLDIALSLNLAGGELASEDAAATFIAAIADAGQRPKDFTFEVPTRSAGTIWPALRRLAAAGARIALDDVASSDEVPRSVRDEIDEIKIARAIVRRSLADASARAALHDLIETARDYGVTAVAVGVEDSATHDLLVDYGCPLEQGYYASKPLASAEVPRWQGALKRVAFGGAAAVALYTGTGRVVQAAELPVATLPVQEPQSGKACCSLHAPAAIPDTGVTMRAVHVAGADLHLESSLPQDVQDRIAAAVARDIVAVTHDMGADFDGTPQVYVFASRGSFALGLQHAFGQSMTDSSALAASGGGVAFPHQSAIAINWQNVSASPQLGIVRHELTHVLTHQLAGVDTDIPAWFDEGNSTLAERGVAADTVRDAHDRSAALAVMRDGSISLRDLSPAGDWTIKDAQLGGRAYSVAAEAVGLLHARLGPDGIADLLRHAHEVGFARAFGEATGMSVADFSLAFPAQLANATGGPWIAHHAVSGGVSWSANGFVPGQELHVSLDGASGYHVEFAVLADRDGTYRAVFGGTAPAGDYTVTVRAGAMTASGALQLGGAI